MAGISDTPRRCQPSLHHFHNSNIVATSLPVTQWRRFIHQITFNLRFVIRHIWGHVKFVPLVSYFLKDDGCFLLQHVSAYLTMPHLTWTQTSLTLSTDPMLRGGSWSSIDAKIMDLLLEKCCWMATADPMYQSGQCINNGDVSSWLRRQGAGVDLAGDRTRDPARHGDWCPSFTGKFPINSVRNTATMFGHTIG